MKSRPVALLVIDVQKELFEKSTPIHCADQLLANINALAAQAHRVKVPVVYIQHSSDSHLIKGSEGWQLHPDLKPLKSDLIVHKRHGNAFEDTVLQQELQARQVKHLVVTGLVSHGCVKATSLGALELGYEVILVKDGHSNFHKQAPKVIQEQNQKLGRAGAILQATAEIDFREL